MRAAAGLDEEVNPYSIRHTVARWMRQNGVPAWEVAAQLGHKSRDYRTTELYAAFDPAYLENAVRAIDLLFDRLRANFAPVDEPFFRSVRPQALISTWKSGAGEGIRTPDPNLGKVVGDPIRKLAIVSHSPINHLKSCVLILRDASQYPVTGVMGGHHVDTTLEIRGLHG